MIKIADIKDRDGLQSWLTDWPKENGLDEAAARAVAVWIAHRAAMRVLPIWWHWILTSDHARQHDLTAVEVLRANLVSGVARKTPTSDTMRAAAAARTAASSAKAATDAATARSAAVRLAAARSATARSAAARSASAAARSAGAGAAAARSAANAAAAASSAATTAAIWSNIRTDCAMLADGRDLDQQRLWQGDNPLHSEWQEIQDSLPQGWEFWRNWYQGALDGTPPNWPLLEQIALIEPKIWDAGPEQLNAEIERLRVEFAIRATPNAERIEINPDTGQLRAVSESALPADHLADALDKMRDAVEIFGGESGGNDMYAFLLPERDLIADAIGRYGQRPVRLHDACNRAVRRVNDKMSSGDCPENDALVNDFVAQLAEVAVDLRGFDDKVRDVATGRALDRMKELPQAAHENSVEAADEVAMGSEGELALELPQDARAAINPALPVQERKEALNRLVGRLLRAWQVGRKQLESGAKLVKDVSVVGAGAGTAGAVVVDGYLWMTGKLPIVLPWLLSLF
jgi:hypothetical protein